MSNFEKVVNPSERGEPNNRRKTKQDKHAIQFAPQRNADQNNGDDQNTAIDFLEPAAESGNVRAMALLGITLFDDYGEPEEALPWLEAAANLGNADAMVTLGNMAADNDQMGTAKTWFLAGIEAGAEDGEICLGLILLEQDKIEEAEVWLLKAADKEDDSAKAALGNICADRNEPAKAKYWWDQIENLDDYLEQP